MFREDSNSWGINGSLIVEEFYTSNLNFSYMKKMNREKCANYKDTQNQEVWRFYSVNDTNIILVEVTKVAESQIFINCKLQKS